MNNHEVFFGNFLPVKMKNEQCFNGKFTSFKGLVLEHLRPPWTSSSTETSLPKSQKRIFTRNSAKRAFSVSPSITQLTINGSKSKLRRLLGTALLTLNDVAV